MGASPVRSRFFSSQTNIGTPSSRCLFPPSSNPFLSDVSGPLVEHTNRMHRVHNTRARACMSRLQYVHWLALVRLGALVEMQLPWGGNGLL